MAWDTTSSVVSAVGLSVCSIIMLLRRRSSFDRFFFLWVLSFVVCNISHAIGFDQRCSIDVNGEMGNCPSMNRFAAQLYWASLVSHPFWFACFALGTNPPEHGMRSAQQSLLVVAAAIGIATLTPALLEGNSRFYVDSEGKLALVLDLGIVENETYPLHTWIALVTASSCFLRPLSLSLPILATYYSTLLYTFIFDHPDLPQIFSRLSGYPCFGLSVALLLASSAKSCYQAVTVYVGNIKAWRNARRLAQSAKGITTARWQCQRCTYSNKGSDSNCAMCSHVRTQWSCPSCASINPPQRNRCVECGSAR